MLNTNIGLIWTELKKYEEADSCFRRALQLAVKYEYWDYALYAVIDRIHNFRYWEKYDQAGLLLDTLNSLAQKTQTTYGMGKALQLSGYALIDLGLIKEGIKKLDQAKNYFREVQEEYEYASAVVFESSALLEIDQPKEAEKLLIEVMPIINQESNVTLSEELYATLSEVYHALGKSDDAYDALKQQSIFKEKILDAEKTHQIALLEIDYETEKKEQEIENLNQQARIQNLELHAKNRNLLLLGILVVLLVVGAGFIYVFLRQKRLVALQQAQNMEQRLLRTQMNPHFIFNAISAIQGYMVQGEGKQAATYLSKFSKLIRQVLDNSRTEFISLDQELNMLENYMYLQNLRRDVPFTFNILVDDALEPEEVAIPPMFAQPFIENAIEHGLASVADARVEIRFSKSDDYLSLIIEDNGVGYGKTQVKVKGHTSHATRITEERIALYRKTTKKEITFTIQRLTDVTQVAFQLPFTYV